MPEPATRILLWVILAAGLMGMSLIQLVSLTFLIVAGLVITRTWPACWRSVRRTRILWLTIFMVYAMTTPGEPLLQDFARWSPSRQGIREGGIQVWRLFLMLSSLALLLSKCSLQQLLGGIYQLLRPFSAWFPVERFAVRIVLTLRYVETLPFPQGSRLHWQDFLARLMSESKCHHPGETLWIEVGQWRRLDILYVLLGLLWLAGVWL